MKTAQVHVTISLSQQISDLLEEKAKKLGLSVADLSKKLVTKGIKEENSPKFKASKATIRAAKQAMKDYEEGKAVVMDDISSFLESKDYSVRKMSKRSERRTQKALQEKDKAVWVDDIHEFFKNL